MRTIFLAMLILAAVANGQERKPNFLIILADDMGYSDLGCYGGEIATPNLDRLAAGGIRFTQFYNTSRCWPTRGALLTGYYAQQIRRDALPGVTPSGGRGVRPKWAKLLPEMLKPAGYRNYHSGKWHVDGQRLANGFDRSYSLEDHDRHLYPRNHFEDDKKLPAVDPALPTHSSILIADHAIKCLKDHAANHGDRPFFHYLCFTAPHFPLQALEMDIKKYKDVYNEGWDMVRQRRYERLRKMGIVNCELPSRNASVAPAWNVKEADLVTRIGAGEVGRAIAWNDLTPEQKRLQVAKMAVHAAMIDRMDQEIGRVLEQLKSMNALEDTVILFLSDNGASAEQIIRGDGHDIAAVPGSATTFLGLGPGWSTCANTPFRMHKSWAHEGGISTPLVVHWPRGIAARNELRHTVGHVIDIVPTLLSLAGAKWMFEVPPPGRDLSPAFAKDISVPRELWFFHEGHRALRIGDIKLVSVKDGPWELYDLSNDRGETKNLAAATDQVRMLSARWTQLLDEFTALAKKDLPAK